MFVFREDYHEKMEPIRKSGETEEQLTKDMKIEILLEKIKGSSNNNCKTTPRTNRNYKFIF